MRVLLDTCVAGQAAEVVRQAGHDVIWAGDWPSDPGDEEILRRATAESRVLATIDKDFGELIIVQGMLHVGLIRLVGFRARDQGPALVQLLSKYESELANGAILTAEPWRVRVRPGMGGAQRRTRAKIKRLALTFTGAIPPEDIGDGWVRTATWPLVFEFDVEVEFDAPVAATSASVEIIKEPGRERVARRVVPIEHATPGGTAQKWRGTVQSVAIPGPGAYRIIIEIDDVEPDARPLRVDQK